jgi:uncharacterized protein
MLGRLVKWLRIIGQDVIYGPHLSGRGLIRAARLENRLILTRDGGLKMKQPPEFIFITSDDYREQLRQVVKACHLGVSEKLFTRCVECNALLQPRSKAEIEALVPPYVFSSQERLSWCPTCHRVYWPATHNQRMVEQLERIGLG